MLRNPPSASLSGFTRTQREFAKSYLNLYGHIEGLQQPLVHRLPWGRTIFFLRTGPPPLQPSCQPLRRDCPAYHPLLICCYRCGLPGKPAAAVSCWVQHARMAAFLRATLLRRTDSCRAYLLVFPKPTWIGIQVDLLTRN